MANVSECKRTKQGTEYNGIRSNTITNRTCQRWDSQSPHHHQEYTADDFPDASVEEASNYCRNPDFSPLGPWCYTTYSSMRVEYCNVPACGKFILSLFHKLLPHSYDAIFGYHAFLGILLCRQIGRHLIIIVGKKMSKPKSWT